MGWHDHRGHNSPTKVAMEHFRFINKSMDSDVVDEKTQKVLIHKEINVVEVNEAAARKKAFRPKLDKDGMLSAEWELDNTFPTGKDWN